MRLFNFRLGFRNFFINKKILIQLFAIFVQPFNELEKTRQSLYLQAKPNYLLKQVSYLLIFKLINNAFRGIDYLDKGYFTRKTILFTLDFLCSTTNPSSKGFFQVFVDQFRSTQTKPINVTTPSHGNLTSYILKKSAVDIGEFNLKYLIAVNAKESSNICRLFYNLLLHYFPFSTQMFLPKLRFGVFLKICVSFKYLNFMSLQSQCLAKVVTNCTKFFQGLVSSS